MIFESVEFFQYRCFMEGSLNFHSDDKQDSSINLITAENGGGKTELLFAFSWALYDFDFKTLQNKEDTPFSLNSEIYRKLENNPDECSDCCWVKLVFNDNNKKYTLKKTEHFKKINGYSSLKRIVETELIIKLKNGVTELPIRDHKYIEKILNEIIPLKVLNGIIFDGERMQKLSSADERSVEGVKGVIFDVTNQEKLEYFLEIISKVETKINSRLSDLSKNTGNRKLDTLSNKIETLENKIKLNNIRLQDATDKLRVCNNELDRISSELKVHAETKELENKRIEAQNNLKKAEGQIQKEVDAFASELNYHGFTLIVDEILDNCQEMIDAYDIPSGLNAGAVESILKYDKCICGAELSSERIAILKRLIDFLPPGNLNSALLEQIHGLRSIQEKTVENLKRHRKNIKSFDSDILLCNENIARYRSQISLSALKDSTKLEDDRTYYLSEQAKFDFEIRTLPGEIDADIIQVNDLREQKESLLEKVELSEKLTEKWKFVNKTKKATSKIRDELQNIALKKINEMLKESYKQIAEKSEEGRDVHL